MIANSKDKLLEHLDNAVEVTAPLDGREEILYEPGELAAAIDRAEDALARMSIDPATPMRDRIFARGGALVSAHRVGRAPKEPAAEKLARIPAGSLAILTHTAAVAILERLDRCSRWFSPGMRGVRAIQPPEAVARAILEGRRRFPILDAVVSAPTVRADGSLIQREGYDAASCLFLDFGGVEWPQVPERPTRSQAEAALAALLEPFKGFPFATPADRSALAGLLLTAVARHALPLAPLGGIDAPAAGTGKTMLAQCCAMLATSAEPVVIAFDRDSPDELKKSVDAALIAGVPAIVIDNIEGQLRSTQLCALSTSGRLSVRLLGFSKMLDLSTRVLVLATGNGLLPVGDLTSRVVMVRLDAGVEDPTSRRFERSALDDVQERRVELIAAALTVIRGGVVARDSEVPPHRPSRFSAWDRIVRRPLIWLGAGDPGATLFEAQHADPERARVEQVLRSWWETFGPNEVTVATALDAPGMEAALAAVLPAGVKDPRAAQKLGIWLRQRVDARAGGLVMRRRDARATFYRVEIASEPEPEAAPLAPPCTTFTPYAETKGRDVGVMGLGRVVQSGASGAEHASAEDDAEFQRLLAAALDWEADDEPDNEGGPR